MKGRGITRTFEDLSLGGNVPQAGDDEASMASISKANFRPRSPLKSPPKMTARASGKPYDVPLPTAIGPGGLVSMLQKLRRIRDVERETMTKQIVDTTMETGDSEKDRTSFEDTFITCRGGDGKDGNANFCMNEAKRRDAYQMATDVEKRIIRQVEHYFGDYNLPKDKWMLGKLEECVDGWFDMETMMTFPRLLKLTNDPCVVLTALAKSPKDLLQIENWGQGRGRVRRNPDYPIPEINEARRISLQERTLFVWGFDKAATSLDDLIEYFENNFGNVVNIRQRTAPIRVKEEEEEENRMESEKEELQRNRQFMGSVFVTFGTRQAAEDFYTNWRHKLIFKERKLQTKWQRDFYNSRAVFNDEFDESTILKTLYVSGFDKKDTTQEELTKFFLRFKGPTALRKRVYRFSTSDDDWQFSGGVFVQFDNHDDAKEFLNLFTETKLSYNGDGLQVKWQVDFFKQKGLFKEQLASLHQ
jgi:hypothetical protein